MQTILHILKQAGGWHHGLYLKVENHPHPALIVDAQDESGPLGLPVLSAAQYSDGLCIPEMCFELGLAGGAHLDPFNYRNDFVGIEHWSRAVIDGQYAHRIQVHEQQERLAKVWDDTLRSQGFVEAFERQLQKPRA